VDAAAERVRLQRLRRRGVGGGPRLGRVVGVGRVLGARNGAVSKAGGDSVGAAVATEPVEFVERPGRGADQGGGLLAAAPPM
jgi:hypothetical protein